MAYYLLLPHLLGYLHVVQSGAHLYTLVCHFVLVSDYSFWREHRPLNRSVRVSFALVGFQFTHPFWITGCIYLWRQWHYFCYLTWTYRACGGLMFAVHNWTLYLQEINRKEYLNLWNLALDKDLTGIILLYNSDVLWQMTFFPEWKVSDQASANWVWSSGYVCVTCRSGVHVLGAGFELVSVKSGQLKSSDNPTGYGLWANPF